VGEEVEQEVEQEYTLSSSSSSSSINDVILAPINHILTSPVERGLDNIEGEGMWEQPPSKPLYVPKPPAILLSSYDGGQPPSKPRYVPKPPKRKKALAVRRKNSAYDWETARTTLGLGNERNNSLIYAAANAASASTDNATTATTTTINSPSKEEVKAENKKLMMHTITLEREVGTAKRKVDCLQTQVKSLSGSLKTEKIKSWNAIEQLLKVTTIQQDKLLSTFHDKIVSIEEGHAISLRKLTRDNNNMTDNNLKSINKLKKRHAKEIKMLSTEYLGDLTRMENDHNNTMVSLLVQIYRYRDVLM
jgi:hypothetical protein